MLYRIKFQDGSVYRTYLEIEDNELKRVHVAGAAGKPIPVATLSISKLEVDAIAEDRTAVDVSDKIPK